MKRTAVILCATTPPKKLQKLFTGALFPEHVNEALYKFSSRHNLKSAIWIPKTAFDYALKPFGVYILPSASLCNILMLTGGRQDSSSGAENFAMKDQILVNADQTSNPLFFENFTKYLVHEIKPNLSTSATKLLHGSNLPAKLEHPGNSNNNSDHESESEPFFFPVEANSGQCITDPLVFDKLKELRRKRKYKSNYWIRSPYAKKVSYKNAEMTAHPGRFNPVWSANYVPRTYTDQKFPPVIARLMQERAACYNYTSRVWITVEEAYNVFRTKFRPERANDGPVIFTTHFTGGLESTAFYCADQFEENESIFPTSQEISFAASGVRLAPEKIRGFPVLSNINKEMDDYVDNLKTASPGPSRLGADTGMVEAQRHQIFKDFISTYDKITLFEVPEFLQGPELKRELGVQLRKQCILRGFSTRHFLSVRSIFSYGLTVKKGEQGVVGPAPIQLWGQAWLDHEVWYNACQLEETLAVFQLIHNKPKHLFTMEHLLGVCCLNCCRVQLLKGFSSNFWVPEWVITMLRWKLNDKAVGVTYKPSHFNGVSKPFSSLGTVFYNIEEVENLSAEDVLKIATYAPHDEFGRPFLHSARALLSMRAFERSYTSERWICLNNQPDAFLSSRKLRRWNRDDGKRMEILPRGALQKSPFVILRSLFFVNEEELEVTDEEELLLRRSQNDQFDEHMTSFATATFSQGKFSVVGAPKFDNITGGIANDKEKTNGNNTANNQSNFKLKAVKSAENFAAEFFAKKKRYSKDNGPHQTVSTFGFESLEDEEWE